MGVSTRFFRDVIEAEGLFHDEIDPFFSLVTNDTDFTQGENRAATIEGEFVDGDPDVTSVIVVEWI